MSTRAEQYKASNRKYYLKNKEKWKEYNQAWRDANKDKIAERNKRYRLTVEGREVINTTARRYRKRNKLKLQARDSAHTAINNGTIKRKTHCEKCGKKEKLEMHHSDYTCPLDIHWLCFSCHRLRTK